MIDAFKQYCQESRIPVAIVFALLFLSTVALAQEHDAHKAHRQMMQQETAATFAEIALPDAMLVTQNGDEVRLVDDVIDGRIVVVDFVYTTCTTVCPVLSATFRQVQQKLGARVGEDIVMVSVSVDPQRDTPARMKSYAARLGASDGWVWLTGDKRNVKDVLEAFGAYTPNFADHPSMILVGDGASGQWTRFLGFPAADQIVNKVEEFAANRMAHHSHDMTAEDL